MGYEHNNLLNLQNEIYFEKGFYSLKLNPRENIVWGKLLKTATLESCITDTRALKQQAHSQTVTGHFNYIKRESIPKNRNGILGRGGEFEKGVPGEDGNGGRS